MVFWKMEELVTNDFNSTHAWANRLSSIWIEMTRLPRTWELGYFELDQNQP